MLRIKSENLCGLVLGQKILNVVINTSMIFNIMLESTIKGKNKTKQTTPNQTEPNKHTPVFISVGENNTTFLISYYLEIFYLNLGVCLETQDFLKMSDRRQARGYNIKKPLSKLILIIQKSAYFFRYDSAIIL